MKILKSIREASPKNVIIWSFAINTFTSLVAVLIIYFFPELKTGTAIIATALFYTPILIINIYYVWNTDRKYKLSDVVLALLFGFAHFGMIYLLTHFKILPEDRFTNLYLIFPLCMSGLNFARGDKNIAKRFYVTCEALRPSREGVLKIVTFVCILVCIISVVLCVLGYSVYSM